MPDRCARLKVGSGFFEVEGGSTSLEIATEGRWGCTSLRGAAAPRTHLEGTGSQGHCRKEGKREEDAGRQAYHWTIGGAMMFDCLIISFCRASKTK